MAIRKVLMEPDPRLHQIAAPVKVFDAELKVLLEDMLDTMYAGDGGGLAAPQIGLLKRIMTIDMRGAEGKGQPANESGPFCMINPEIIWSSNKSYTCRQGCLSVPNLYMAVTRPAEVRVRYQDQKGVFHEVFADGIFAVYLQHEVDHLNGITLLDHQMAMKKQSLFQSILK